MTESLPPEEVPTPRFVNDLVPLPYNPTILLDPQTQTRWLKANDGLERDYDGEAEWGTMAAYVDKSYSDVFLESYRHALDTKNA